DDYGHDPGRHHPALHGATDRAHRPSRRGDTSGKGLASVAPERPMHTAYPQPRRRRGRHTSWSYARWIVLALVLIFFLFPIYWMLITSFKGVSLWTHYPPLFYPDAIHFENYGDALFHWGGLKGLEDSAIVCTATTVLSMLIGV